MRRTSMKMSRFGGQEQGMLMLFRPLQLPVPSGLAPCWTPKSGTRLTSTTPALELLLELLLLELLVVGADVVRMEAADNVFSSPLAVLVVMLSQFHSPYTSPTVL